MSHTSDIERADQDGLREIRSWASRSPDSARPGFRTRSRPRGRGRASSRLVGSGLLALLLFLLSLAGYRFFQSSRGASDLAFVPEPEQVAPVVVQKDVAAPPAAEAVPDVHAARPALPVEERPRKEAAVVQRKTAPKEPGVTSPAVVSSDAFESEPAVLLAVPAADYPDAARGTGTSAEVIVGFTIDETGAVRDPAVESSRVQGHAPEALFEEAALAAAQRARFDPARERGVPTPSWSTLTFSFATGSQPAGI